MKSTKSTKKILIFILLASLLAIFNLSCKNDLLETIEDEVVVAVTPPEISTLYPLAGASDVAIDTNSITITFSKAIDSSTANNATITILDADNAAVSGTFSTNGQTVSFTPSGNLEYLIQYTITITSGVKDVDGNSIVENFSWSFTTTFDPISDRVAPIVDDFIINKGSTATSNTAIVLDIFANDDEGNLDLKYRVRPIGADWPVEWAELGDEGSIADVNANVIVELGQLQTFELIVMDATGNISEIYTQTILYENNPPIILNTTPTGLDVPGDTTVVSIIFNEEMSPQSISSSNVYVEDSNAVTTLTMESASLSLKSFNNIPNSQIELSGISLEQFESYTIVIDETVQDIGETEMGELKTYSFSTSSAKDETAPELSLSINSLVGATTETFIRLDNSIEATNWKNLRLNVDAQDDYNGVKDMKIWAGSSSEPAGYTDHNITYDIDIDPLTDGSGIKYLFYKIRDHANNENDGYIQIILDQEVPTVSNLSIASGESHSTSVDGKVSLTVEYNDTLPGDVKMTGVTHMAISNTDNTGGSDWLEISSEIAEWELDIGSGNGSKQVYIKVKDFLGQESTVNTDMIIWDTEAPTITIDANNFLETNIADTQLTTIEDNIDGSPTIFWEKVSGVGTVLFSNSGIAQPDISASQDDNYEIKVTVTDGAGFSTSKTIPFIWDETKPANTLSVSTPQYNNDQLPEWTWSEVSGANYYRASFSIVPDWNDSGDYTQIASTTFSPATLLADGNSTLTISAWDNAGNKADTEDSAISTVDSTPPIIYGDGQIFVANSLRTLDFTDNSTGDGEFTDTGGSLITSTLWEQISGSQITFANATGTGPSLSVPDAIVPDGNRGMYPFKVTVTDNAGNSTMASFTLDWDREAPFEPNVSGLQRTPNSTPTWSWQSGGNNGNGIFRYSLDGGASWLNSESGSNSYSYTPASSLPSDTNGVGDENTTGPALYTHTLTVQEKDIAGNWSNSGEWSIYIDSLYIAPPDIAVTVDGDGRISPRTTTSVTWTWSSGADKATGVAYYRFSTSENNGSSWTVRNAGSIAETYTLTPGSPPSSGVNYFKLKVEERNDSIWTGIEGISTVTIDLQGPTAPTINYSSRTKDTTPTWTWSTNGSSDGTGIFQYQLDTNGWVGPVTQTAFTPTTAQSQGAHTLYVQEQDPLGNWSSSRTATTTIDTTPPTLNSIVAHTDTNSGTSETYTNSTTVNIYVDAVTAGETGLQMSSYNATLGQWNNWTDHALWTTGVLATGEGGKYAYLRLMDDVGNISGYKSDYIILDQTAPTSHSITLNNGELYTSSYDAKFNATATDNYSSSNDIYVQHAYLTDSGWYTSSWEVIGNSLYFDSRFTDSTGYKYVYARFKDAAGNVTAGNTPTSGWVNDSVYMKLVTMRFAHKGYYSNGDVGVYYNESYSPSSVAYITRYYVYSTTNPTADPNVSYSGFTNHSYADHNASSYKIVDIPEGEIRYFWVRPYNGDLGGYGYFTPTGSMGFSSDVTVVYNDDNSTDTDMAEYTKELLENTYYTNGINYGGYISGTMPSLSVTLLPEDFINNTSYSSYNRIYGDPVITTPYTTFSYSSTAYDILIRHIATNGRGLMTMGYNGLEMLYRINANWTAWSLSGTQPNKLNFFSKVSLGSSTSIKKKPATTSEYVWQSPLSNNYLTSNYSGSTITLGGYTSNVTRYGLNLGTLNMTLYDGQSYAYAVSTNNYQTVVRQGRFMFFGYYDVPGRNYTSVSPNYLKYQYGQPFFINLIDLLNTDY